MVENIRHTVGLVTDHTVAMDTSDKEIGVFIIFAYGIIGIFLHRQESLLRHLKELHKSKTTLWG